jgi:hypothetical protein
MPDCEGNCTNVSMPDPVNEALEDAEWSRWQDKLLASGVKVGP